MKSISRAEQTFCVILPAFMEASVIGWVVMEARRYAAHVIVVDDGSTDGTAEAAARAGAVVLRNERNLGKGAALNIGFQYARDHTFDYLVTMDSDGQHNPADIPRFVEAYIRTGIVALIGNRMAEAGRMTWVRRWTHRLMSRLLSREMGQYVPDTQCGFRLYRCDVIPFVAADSSRYAAESEILLHVAERGIRIDTVPISLVHTNGGSGYRPIQDTLRFFRMLFEHRRHRPAGRSL